MTETHLPNPAALLPLTSPSPLRPTYTKQRVTLTTGIDLAYVTAGVADGAPLVLLHGLSDSWRSWEPMLPWLPAHVRAYAVSLRGHGDSDKPTSGYSTTGLASDIAAFMDAAGIETAVVVGHSMGSVIARRFAVDFPERVAGLVLEGAIGSFASIPDSEGFAAMIHTLSDPVPAEFVREFQLGTITQPVPREYFERFGQESLKLPAHVWHAAIDGLAEDDSFEAIAAFTAPTLLLWGDQDAVALREAQEGLLSKLPNSSLLTYAGTGHAVHWEQPERVAAGLMDFVDTVLTHP